MAKCLHPVALPGAAFLVPCGKCVNCCKAYSMEWALRCMDELEYNGGIGCMLTLTYAITDGSLHKDDLQRFVKRLRARLAPQKIRYFAAGEYGGRGNRPHYHMIIFGWRPDDLRRVGKYYASDYVSNVWSLGYVSVGDVTLQSCMYAAKYLQKLDDRDHDVPPFTMMSLKPGLGVANLSYDDLKRERIYRDGKSYALPKYYIKYFGNHGYDVQDIIDHRCDIAVGISGDMIDYRVVADLQREADIISERLAKKLAKNC